MGIVFFLIKYFFFLNFLLWEKLVKKHMIDPKF